MNPTRTLLPMLGATPVAVVLLQLATSECADACTKPDCNTSSNGYFKDIADKSLSRRSMLGLSAVGASALVIGPQLFGAADATAAPLVPMAPGKGWPAAIRCH